MPGHNDWIKKSLSDLKLASKAIGDDETVDPAVYLSHQCAEKALKAILMFSQKHIPKVHNLKLLLVACSECSNDFILLSKQCGLLSSYEFDSRYPKDNFHVDQSDLVMALRAATDVLDFVKNKIQYGVK